MTLKPWHSFVGLGIALVVGLICVSVLSIVVIERDGAEKRAVRRATLEENVRLSLWRMDSELAPLISNESTRPALDWRQLPAAAFAERSAYVKVHFQFDDQGRLTSPQGSAALERLGSLVSRDQLTTLLEKRRELLGREGVASTIALNASNPQYEQNLDTYSAPVQSFKNAVEWGARARAAQQARGYHGDSGVGSAADGLFDQEALAHPGEASMLPLWIGSDLVLARRVTVGGRTYLQGAWLDWEGLETKLLADVSDLLPAASLEPVEGLTPEMKRVLAALPARIEPGALPFAKAPISPQVVAVLVTAWVGVVLAALAVGGLLIGAVSLSERRGAFVSAVTHELRTPLTTFRMYTEMLSEGMIQDEAKKQRYLDTLKREAIRLGHLVENVLSYARIERGRARAAAETIAIPELIARFEDRLRERAGQAEMDLDVELTLDEGVNAIHVDASLVEQILFNLVDNACKYGAGPIVLGAERRGRAIALSVTDQGPGITGGARRNLFTAFSKSAHQAANSAPGVGLGLALSRRLARSMKGDLRYDDARAGGARFLVTFDIVPFEP